MRTPSIRVALCDDHRIVTDGLSQLLSDVPGIECVGTAGNGSEALYLLDHVAADVLITDLDMPDMDGAQLTQRLREKQSPVKVIVLSMHEEPALVQRLMELGADGYLVKSSGKEEMVLAIRNVHQGHKHFSSDLMNALLRQRNDTREGRTLVQDLSDREVEVLAALAEGLSNKEIGERLFISPRTVDTHRTNLMRKLRTHHVAGLVRIAIKAGLVQ